ncbi:MAG: AAA family ATPase [Bacteroidota bacterium]
MIPLKLTIEGLYSYRASQTIDFSNLTRSGLFGIFGGVGSGKSSILEAISFALYGESERLNSRDKRSYNMMNLKSAKLLIDFEFKSQDDTRYRFVVTGARNKKRFEEVGTFDRRAFRFVKNDWFPISTDDIETITGLNYQNFRRTIIIPQGKFQEFLQLNSSDRTTMLKELFNLSRYELSDKIGRMEARNDTAIQLLTGEMQGVGEISQETISGLENKRVLLLEEKTRVTSDLGQHERLVQEAEALKKLSADHLSRSNRQADLMKSKDVMQDLETRLAEFELCSRVFRTDVNLLEMSDLKFRNTAAEMAVEQRVLADLHKNLLSVRKSYEELKKEFDNREVLLRESEEWAKLSSIKENRAIQQALVQREKDCRSSLEGALKRIQAAKDLHSANVLEMESLKEKLPDYKMLADIQGWFAESHRLERTVAENQRKTTDLKATLATLNNQAVAEIFRSALFGSDPLLADVQGFIHEAELLSVSCESRIMGWDEQISGLEIRKKLEDYAAGLHDGKPCPLCGSEDHPRKLNPTDVANGLELARGGRKTDADKLKKCNDLVKFLTPNLTLQESVKQQLGDLADARQDLLQEKARHQGAFTWAGFDKDREEEVVAKISFYEQVSVQIATAGQQLKRMADESEKDAVRVEKQKLELNQILQELTAAATKIQMLAGQITLVDPDAEGELSSAQLLEKSKEAIKQHTLISGKFTGATNELEKLNRSISELTGKIGEKEKNQVELQVQIGNIRLAVEKKLKENGDRDLSQVMVVLQSDMEVEPQRKRLQDYRQEVAAGDRFLKDVETQMAGRTYDEEAHHLFRQETDALKLRLDTLNLELGGIESSIIAMKGKALKYASLKKDLDKATIRGKDITELKNLFRGSGFVNYVSTVYLDNLCKAANERFGKLTRQKLGLELAEDNSFQVRDYMNEGHLRNVKTLSGGQTFQASLSLALSLADSIHKLAGSSENFFFLDEGFGTLDKDTLDVAFETLKSLSKENRIVGVISHVEEMQTEIETYLKVTNDENHGSVVKGSWES